FMAKSLLPDKRKYPLAANSEFPITPTRVSSPLLAETASGTDPLRSWPGSNATFPDASELVSPHARGPVLASSVTVHPAGEVGSFATDRATGKMVASWNGELRGCVMGCSVYCCA